MQAQNHVSLIESELGRVERWIRDVFEHDALSTVIQALEPPHLVLT